MSTLEKMIIRMQNEAEKKRITGQGYTAEQAFNHQNQKLRLMNMASYLRMTYVTPSNN